MWERRVASRKVKLQEEKKGGGDRCIWWCCWRNGPEMHFFSLFSISQQSLVSLSMVTFSHLSSAQKTEKRGPRKEVLLLLLLLLLPMKSRRTSGSGDGQIVCEQAKQKHTHMHRDRQNNKKNVQKRGKMGWIETQKKWGGETKRKINRRQERRGKKRGEYLGPENKREKEVKRCTEE